MRWIIYDSVTFFIILLSLLTHLKTSTHMCVTPPQTFLLFSYLVYFVAELFGPFNENSEPDIGVKGEISGK